MFKIDKYVKIIKKVPRRTGLRYTGCKKDPSCRPPPPPETNCPEPQPDLFCEEFVAFRKLKAYNPILDCSEKHDPKMWRNVFLFLCLPLLIGFGINQVFFPTHEKRPKYIEMSYLRLRPKPFPFHENPDHSLFHNPLRNPVPGGYEVAVPEDEEYDPGEVMQLREYR